MTDDFQLDPDADTAEPLGEGGTWLLDLVSAVDHLRRGYRPGFTVWDAFDEATRWASDNSDGKKEGAAEDIDSFRLRPDRHEAVQRAIRTWALVMAQRFNSGCNWPHPAVRRTFPPPLVNGGTDADDLAAETSALQRRDR